MEHFIGANNLVLKRNDIANASVMPLFWWIKFCHEVKNDQHFFPFSPMKLSTIFISKRFLGIQNLKIAESRYSFSRSFSSDVHRKKTSEWRKAIKCRIFIVLDCFPLFWFFLPMSVRRKASKKWIRYFQQFLNFHFVWNTFLDFALLRLRCNHCFKSIVFPAWQTRSKHHWFNSQPSHVVVSLNKMLYDFHLSCLPESNKQQIHQTIQCKQLKQLFWTIGTLRQVQFDSVSTFITDLQDQKRSVYFGGSIFSSQSELFK